MSLIKFAISFAQNIIDGRLDAICHTPFIVNSQEVENPEEHFLIIQTKTFQERKEDITINFCIDYTESDIPNRSIAEGLLDLFVEKFLDRIKIKSKIIRKIEQDNESFMETCDEIFQETIKSLDLMSGDFASFLLQDDDDQERKMKLLFSSISVQGLPVATKFYSDMSSHFRFTTMDEEEMDTNTVLENLISAQLSTLLFQSLVHGTNCNYIIIHFSDLVTLSQRTIAINFFPVSSSVDEGDQTTGDGEQTTGESHNMIDKEGFFFIIMSEGDPSVVKLFQRSISPLITDTGLLAEKFNGNVTRYHSLETILNNFPRNLEID
ncbi:MAG: hypothetical protein ACTSUE_07045 [Promethearchaeota archaeon]